MAEVRLVAVSEDLIDRRHEPGCSCPDCSLATAWEAGITEDQAAHLDHALHPDRCSDCEGLSRKLRHAFGHTGPERWPWS